jgi:galactose mutarotase-like enzyme
VDTYTIASDALRVGIRRHGAELCQLTMADGTELLWNGDPTWWSGQAPVLFPVVGALHGSRLVHQGTHHPMPRHGFARTRDFRLVRLTAHSCRLRLEDDAETRAIYPFRFRLDLDFSLDEGTLTVRHELHNPGDTELPASLGAHPGFRWPLLPGIPKTAHHLDFEKAESGPLPGVDANGLLTAATRPNPVHNRQIALDDSLFTADALVFPQVQSHAVRFTAPGAPAVVMHWEGFPQLGVWSKPGAGFLCIEPWRGHASPAGWDGEFADKPGLVKLAPGGSTQASYAIRVMPAERD